MIYDTFYTLNSFIKEYLVDSIGASKHKMMGINCSKKTYVTNVKLNETLTLSAPTADDFFECV